MYANIWKMEVCWLVWLVLGKDVAWTMGWGVRRETSPDPYQICAILEDK